MTYLAWAIIGTVLAVWTVAGMVAFGFAAMEDGAEARFKQMNPAKRMLVYSLFGPVVCLFATTVALASAICGISCRLTKPAATKGKPE